VSGGGGGGGGGASRRMIEQTIYKCSVFMSTIAARWEKGLLCQTDRQ